MPLDVPTRAFVVPTGVDADTLISFLQERFSLDVDLPVTAEATVYDTVDRRLRAAGLEVTAEGGRGSARLVLHEGAGAAAGRGPARRPGRRPLPRARAARGPAPRSAGAACWRSGRCCRSSACARPPGRCGCSTSDDKTVVRLSVVTPAAVVQPRPGPAPSPAARATRPPAPWPWPAGSTVVRRARLPAALRAGRAGAGRRAVPGRGRCAPRPTRPSPRSGATPPGSAAPRSASRMLPGERTDAAAVSVLAELAAITEANLAGTLADLDTEFLHDLRVSVRKARSVLREMRRAFPAEALQAQRDALKWVQNVTGDVRDLDVQLLDWPGLAAKVPPDRQVALEPVHVLVGEHRTRAFNELSAVLKGTEFRERWDGLPRLPRPRPRRRDGAGAHRGRAGGGGPAHRQVGRHPHPQGLRAHGGDGRGDHRREPGRRPPRAAQEGQGAALPARAVRRPVAHRGGQAHGQDAQGPAGRAGHPPGPRRAGRVAPGARPRAGRPPRRPRRPAGARHARRPARARAGRRPRPLRRAVRPLRRQGAQRSLVDTTFRGLP